MDLAATHSIDERGTQRGGEDYMDPLVLQFDLLVTVGYGALIMLGAFAGLQWTFKPLAYVVDISQKQPGRGS